MENKESIDIQLIRYLLNESDPAERKAVEQWLEAQPGNRVHFEKLKQVWLLTNVPELDKINVDNEWQQAKQNIREHEAAELVYMDGKRRSIVPLIAKIAVAASVVLMIGLWWFSRNDRTTADDHIANANDKQKQAPAAAMRQQVNNTGKPMEISMQDGSVILLEDNSELKYEEPFAADARSVYLIGKAFFKVAKDTSRSFTVYSGNIATTVLGTEFTVTSFANADRSSVRLHEGKVSIKAFANSKGRFNKEIILKPGQELIFDNRTMIAQVKDVASGSTVNGVLKDASGSENDENSWYMFNNESVGHVFDQLKEMYSVNIVYNKKDVQNLYFIGKLDKQDSVQGVLEQICTLNDLKLAKKGNTYFITKN